MTSAATIKDDLLHIMYHDYINAYTLYEFRLFTI